MSNELYPYQNQYVFYLETVKQYKERTLSDANSVVTAFWNFYLGSDSNGSIRNVTESNVRSFLIYAETQIPLANSTLNKFLVHLKSYFAWLNAHDLISKLPTLFVDGRPIDRSNTVVINWTDYLDDFLTDDRLSDVTKKVFLAISLGNLPNKLISLTNRDISLQINATTQSNNTKNYFLEQNMNLNDFYLTSSKHGQVDKQLKTNVVLQRNLKKDAKFIPFRCNLLSLRQGFVYSKVLNTAISDDDLMSMLHCNFKTLNYYKKNTLFFDFVDYATIRK